jgi:PKD repeat protein
MSPACSDDEIGNVTVFAEPTEGEAPLTVEFLARTGGDDTGFTYQWNFGDGSTSEEQDPTHTYTEPGEYFVDLEVRGPDGGRNGETLTVTVTGGAAAGAEHGSGDAAGDGDESAGIDGGGYAAWQEAVDAACATATAAAAQVEGDPNSPEALAQLVEINNAESAAIDAAGVPSEDTEEAEEWINLRNRGSELFVDLATNPPTAADDPRIAELDTIAIELDALSAERGLESCRAAQ